MCCFPLCFSWRHPGWLKCCSNPLLSFPGKECLGHLATAVHFALNQLQHCLSKIHELYSLFSYMDIWPCCMLAYVWKWSWIFLYSRKSQLMLYQLTALTKDLKNQILTKPSPLWPTGHFLYAFCMGSNSFVNYCSIHLCGWSYIWIGWTIFFKSSLQWALGLSRYWK